MKVTNIFIPSGVTASGDLKMHERPIYASADGVIAGYKPQYDDHDKITGYKPITAHSGDLIDYMPAMVMSATEYPGYSAWHVNSAVYSTAYHPGEWMTIKEYLPLSGFGENNDPTISFGNKVLTDQYDNPYSAYYSQYNENGRYTDNSATYQDGNYDFYYHQVSDHGYKPKTEFSGGKYL
jgi:hypothetical protein